MSILRDFRNKYWWLGLATALAIAYAGYGFIELVIVRDGFWNWMLGAVLFGVMIGLIDLYNWADAKRKETEVRKLLKKWMEENKTQSKDPGWPL